LRAVREICSAKSILLIFDEVITGFRVAFGGRKEIMEKVSPLGDVYQAGTLSGNPIATRAGIYVLSYLKEHQDTYEVLRKQGDTVKSGMLACARRYGIPYTINSATGMFTGFFTEGNVRDYESANASDRKVYEKYFKGMLEEGIFFAPSQFEAAFLTLSHGEDEIAKMLDACEKVFRAIKTE